MTSNAGTTVSGAYYKIIEQRAKDGIEYKRIGGVPMVPRTCEVR